MRIFSNAVEIVSDIKGEILVVLSTTDRDFVEPILNDKYYGEGDLHYGKGKNIGGKTYILFQGEANVLQVINLSPQKEYIYKIYKWENNSYILYEDVIFTTSFDQNQEVFNIEVKDNRTRLPLKDVYVTILDKKNNFVFDFGFTDNNGIFKSIKLIEGAYSIITDKSGYYSKEKRNVFISRKNPLIDNRFRFFDIRRASTVVGGDNPRRELDHRPNLTIFLDESGNFGQGFNKYIPTANPSKITKI